MNTLSILQSLRHACQGDLRISNLIPALAIGLAICVSGFSQSNAQNVKWYPDVASATQEAKKQNKLVFMHFTATWCKPCRHLETFVYSSPDVQRALDQNVIAVKVDVDANVDLVQEYGVASVPYDIAITPAGRVVSKRKSPKESTGYAKMVQGYHSLLARISEGESPALNQGLAELTEALEQQPKQFEGRPISFTPDAPTHDAPLPSVHSAELKRKSKFINNPFVKQPKPAGPQRVVNAFNPVQAPATDSTIQNPSTGFAPAGEFEPSRDITPSGDFAPSSDFVFESTKPPMQIQSNNSFLPSEQPVQQPANLDGADVAQTTVNPFAFQNQQPTESVDPITSNPTVSQNQPAPPSEIALELEQPIETPNSFTIENAQTNNDVQTAEPKIVMDDKFFGAPQPKHVEAAEMLSDTQAKINLPGTNEFLPPEAPGSLGAAEAKIVIDQTSDESSEKDQFQNHKTKAMPASSSKVASASASPAKSLEMGLDMASRKTTKPNYALHGKCPVTLLTKSKWVDGNPKWGCVHRNRIYIFTSERNLKIFQTDPDAYSPILAGYDPVIFQETGRLVDGLEKHGVFMGKQPHQRIVLFANATTRAKFKKNPKKYLEVVRQAMETTGASSTLLR